MSGGRPSNQESYFIDNINIFAYYRKSNQNIAAINLLHNGLKILHSAIVVKNFDIYRNIQFSEHERPLDHLIAPFRDNSLMDDIRIVTCFENYMKAVLLRNDFVVHKITDVLRLLKSQQRERPIKISEVFQESTFENFNPLNTQQSGTNYQTLNFSWMLKPKYQEVINLPSDLMATICEINEERNKLHFVLSQTFSFGNKTIDRYNMIIAFANTTIMNCITQLKAEMKVMQKN